MFAGKFNFKFNLLSKYCPVRNKPNIKNNEKLIDDIANQLAGKTVVPGDLKDSEYNNLYVLKRKKGGYRFENRKYGAPAK